MESVFAIAQRRLTEASRAVDAVHRRAQEGDLNYAALDQASEAYYAHFDRLMACSAQDITELAAKLRAVLDDNPAFLRLDGAVFRSLSDDIFRLAAAEMAEEQPRTPSNDKRPLPRLVRPPQ